MVTRDALARLQFIDLPMYIRVPHRLPCDQRVFDLRHTASFRRAPVGGPGTSGAPGLGRPASCDGRASPRSEGAIDRTTAEEVGTAAGADDSLTCSAIAAAISREVERLPTSANAATASASEGATLA